MLYIFTFAALFLWLAFLVRKKMLSWHSLVAAYVIAVTIVDPLEVTINLLLNFYRFPAHLLNDVVLDNQVGIIFSDTLILPCAIMIYIHYALRYKRRITVPLFTILFAILELVFYNLGYLRYFAWCLIPSMVFYAAGFFAASTWLARPIAWYRPPIPRALRLLCFSYTVHMWIGAVFALPMLAFYQFTPGLLENPMADDRLADLLSGLVFGLISALIVPGTRRPFKIPVLLILTLIGFSFGLFSYSMGWLVYHNWNHFLMALRYFVPFLLIMLYNEWEDSYEKRLEAAPRNIPQPPPGMDSVGAGG